MASRLGRNIEEAFTDATIFAAASYAVKKLFFTAGEKAGEAVGDAAKVKIKELDQLQARKKLFRDLQSMSFRDKRRVLGLLKEATADCTENRLVKVLGDLPCSDTEGYTPALKLLNDELPARLDGVVSLDEIGQIELALLDDDGIWQEFNRAKHLGKQALAHVTDAVRTHGPEAQRKLESIGDGLAPLVDDLTGWLRRHGGR